MKIAFFDRTEYDDLDAYRRFGELVLCTRFTAKKAQDADVIFCTYSRPPDTGRVIVNMASTDRRHLSHITKSEIIQAPQWNAHAVAAWTLARIPDDPRLRVVVVGRGQIGMRVFRFLRSRGYPVMVVPHDAPRLPPVDVITLHVRLSPATRGWFGSRFFVTQRGALLINSARRDLVPDDALRTALRNGQVASAHLDGGPDFGDPRVIVTPHDAWKSDTSRRLRPRRVLDVLRGLARRPGFANASADDHV